MLRRTLVAVAAALAALGLYFALGTIRRRYRARHSVERAMGAFMIVSATLAILTTLGIVVSLVYEALAFFALVPVQEFLFGTRWEPQIALRADQVAGQGAFGMLPVLYGTAMISAIAMLVALLGLTWSGQIMGKGRDADGSRADKHGAVLVS